jgi:mannitol/fructose-specific phosphotransferase system IIA component (Ntr-type)
MLLSEILHERVVKMRVRAQGKAQAIEEMVDLLIESGEIPLVQRAHILEVIAEREQSVSTGMEFGLALPHGATDRVDGIIGALGLAPHGIDFQCRDGQPANIIILLVIPRKSFQEHLHTISSIAKLMRNKSLRDGIIGAGDVPGMLKAIEQEEARLGLVTYKSKP